MARYMGADDGEIFRLRVVTATTRKDGTQHVSAEVLGPYRTVATARGAATRHRGAEARNNLRAERFRQEYRIDAIPTRSSTYSVERAATSWEEVPDA